MLDKALLLQTVWEEKPATWRKELDLFLFGKRGEQVLKLWGKITHRLPDLHKDVFQRFRAKSDTVICTALTNARKAGVVWQETAKYWGETLKLFLSDARGRKVFHEWLSLPCIRQKLKTEVIVANLVHELAINNKANLLQVLVKQYPTSKDLKVCKHAFKIVNQIPSNG